MGRRSKTTAVPTANLTVTVTFAALLEAIARLGLEDKLALVVVLDRQILEEEERLGRNPEEEAQVEQARRDYEAGNYITLDELRPNTQRRA